MTTIQVLGIGCKRCVAMKANAETAVKNLGIEAQVEKIEDINEIAKYGVFSTPALVVDGEVKFAGKVASAAEIMAAIQN